MSEKQSMFKKGDTKRRRVLDEVRQFSTLVGHNTTITGRLEGDDNYIIDGRFEGDCRVGGVLVLGETGQWVGNIDAANCILSGEVTGDVTVSNKLELTATARVRGCLTSPAIAIAEGAIHQGEIHMARQSDIVRFTERRSGE